MHEITKKNKASKEIHMQCQNAKNQPDKQTSSPAQCISKTNVKCAFCNKKKNATLI